jgi:para-aminobenzoate synthetase component 1
MGNSKSVLVYEEVKYNDPVFVFNQFLDQKNPILLESNQYNEMVGRYSFIVADPFSTIAFSEESDVFDAIRQVLHEFSLPRVVGLPPFQGGVAGYISYDFLTKIEEISQESVDDKNWPLLALGVYDVVVAFDHHLKKSWVISTGFPEIKNEKRFSHARERLQWCKNIINKNNPLTELSLVTIPAEEISCNFNKKEYIDAVSKVIGYIAAGDIFEANISQRFLAGIPGGLSPFDLYRKIRTINPAFFSAFIHIDGNTIVSASPERFLKVIDREIEARPIKGTRSRDDDPVKDEYNAQALVSSPKDNAENIMIVDLMRNDLSRVCEDGSVKVPQMCGLESYQAVHHLVSVVTGIIKKEYDAVDVLQATFPGGSITGAPKIRAMQIIDEIEPTRRGPYCGSAGYIGFNSAIDFSILIRSYLLKDNTVSFQAGGAVVLDSSPEEEYAETLVKAKAFYRGLTESV